MILQTLQVAATLLFTLFIPGFFIVQMCFKEMNKPEKLALMIAISIMVTTAIAIILGYNQEAAEMTGGISSKYLWRFHIIVSFILSSLYLFKEKPITRWRKARKWKTSD